MYQFSNSPWSSSSYRFLPDLFMTLSFHFILVTWEILVLSSMSLTELSTRSKCHPGTSPVAFLGCFCVSWPVSWVLSAHISSSTPAFLQGVCFCWPPTKPCFPLPHRCLLPSSLFGASMEAGVAFGSPYVYFESVDFFCLPVCWNWTYFSSCCCWELSKNGRRQLPSWIPGSHSEPHSQISLYLLCSPFLGYLSLILVPSSNPRKFLKMFLFVNCPF